jgi:hypothetical protein
MQLSEEQMQCQCSSRSVLNDGQSQTANVLGLIVPDKLLARADEVIKWTASDDDVVGSCETSTMSAVRSASGGKPENNCSLRDLPVMTQSGHKQANFSVTHNAALW